MKPALGIDPESDAHVIERSRDASEPFRLIFDRHVGAVHRFLSARVGLDEAEDLTAETFAVAWRKRSAYAPIAATARPWLLGIAVRLAQDHERAKGRRRRAFARAAERDSRDETADAAARLDAGRLAAQLARALATLRREDRDVVLLFALGELSYEEIAIGAGHQARHGALAPAPRARPARSRAARRERSMIAHDPLDELRRLGALLPPVDRDARERIWQTATSRSRRSAPPGGADGGRCCSQPPPSLALALAGAAVAGGWLGNEPAPSLDRLPVGTTPYSRADPRHDGQADEGQGLDRDDARTTSRCANLGVRREALELARRKSDGAICASLHGAGACTLARQPRSHLVGVVPPALRVAPARRSASSTTTSAASRSAPRPATYRAQVANAGLYFEFPLGVRARRICARSSRSSPTARASSTPVPWRTA